jgi:hypothetical protein
MKIEKKGNLNAGAHFFIKEKELTGRLIVQQRPIKDWSYWLNNDLFEVKIRPTILHLEELEDSWLKRYPYQLYSNRRHITALRNWEEALDMVQYNFERKSKPLGIGPLNIVDKFAKNEPTITFSEVHEIIKRLELMSQTK